MGFIATMPIISGWRFEEEAYQEELNHYETLGAHCHVVFDAYPDQYQQQSQV